MRFPRLPGRRRDPHDGAFYERFRALDPASIDVDALVAAHKPWPEHRALLEERFGPLFAAVVKHAEPGYPDPETLRGRLQRIVDEWDELQASIASGLRTRASLEEELRAAGCPVRFRDLGLDRDRARQAITWSKDIRNRYTILHAAWELGLLEQWADEALELLYE